MPEPKKVIWSDINLAFTAHPVTGELTRKTNRDAVRQSVKCLVLTNFYERPFKPNLGCGVYYHLFENYTPATKQIMEKAVSDVITQNEPRANLLGVSIDDSVDVNGLLVKIVFSVNNDSNPVVLDVLLERVR